MAVKDIQIPTTIKDASTIRFIRYLLSLLIELEARVEKLESL